MFNQQQKMSKQVMVIDSENVLFDFSNFKDNFTSPTELLLGRI
jgi:hypothetical protein